MKVLLTLACCLTLCSSFGLHTYTVEKQCLVCKVVFFLADELIKESHSRETLGDVATFLCKHFHIEDKYVCNGVINEYKADVQEIIADVIVAPKQACGFILGAQCSTVYIPLKDWTVPLPPPPQTKHTQLVPDRSQNVSRPARILQLSDIHYDTKYTPNSATHCGEPLCCRGPPLSVWSLDGSNGAWKYGDYRNCDTPLWTLENMLSHISKTHQFDHIYMTGDLVAHNVWNETRMIQMKTVKTITALITKYFSGVPIFPAIGNHEAVPTNSFLAPSFDIPGLSAAWIYKDLFESWSHWKLKPDSTETVLKAGYYTTKANDQLRIVTLNMNYCTLQNGLLFLNTTDPAGMLHWLVKTLHEAELKSEKVHILGHQMPSVCYSTWRKNYNRIINRFRGIISGLFFGHSHKDYYELQYDDNMEPIAVAYISPSITPYSFLNMGYRLYEISTKDWGVLDHSTYILNLTEAHLTGELNYKFEYSALEAYNLPDMSPASWHHLSAGMVHNITLFQLYQTLFYKSHPQQFPCYQHEYCRKEAICRTGFQDKTGYCGLI